jgi:hypothetical protein
MTRRPTSATGNDVPTLDATRFKQSCHPDDSIRASAGVLTIMTDAFPWFSSVSPGEFRDNIQIRPRPLPFRFFPSYCRTLQACCVNTGAVVWTSDIGTQFNLSRSVKRKICITSYWINEVPAVEEQRERGGTDSRTVNLGTTQRCVISFSPRPAKFPLGESVLQSHVNVGSTQCTLHGPNRKHSQRFLNCCLRIRCRGNLFAEPLPTNGSLLWLHYFGLQVSRHSMLRQNLQTCCY